MSGTARVFISYSHQNEDWKDGLLGHLAVLEGEGLEIWDDRRIAAGDDWHAEIGEAIERCDVALLLVSRHFLTSRFILEEEVPLLLLRRQEQGIRVIPVILAPCQWQRISWLKPIQARPTDGNPLSGMSAHDAEAALSDLAGEIADLLLLSSPKPVNQSNQPTRPPVVALSKLPRGAENFLGREEELALLDAAWAKQDDGKGLSVVTLIAPGGTGKTALMKRWIDRLAKEGWHGAERVFGWSFYSQGTGDDRQASDEVFLSEALKWFGVTHDPAASAWDKGKLLARAVGERRTLLILDGCEPLQYPPGPLAGELHASGLKSLLGQLALNGQPGLTVVGSREALADLAEFVRNPDHADGAVLRRELHNLTEDDGARLLHKLGCVRAGAAAIGADDEELRAASREIKGHALTLNLLGRYLREAENGDIRRRALVHLIDAADSQGGHTSRVLAAYERWFERAGEKGKSDNAVELAALRLLGFFDRPADSGCVGALRQAPPIAGLTESLQEISAARWRTALTRLADCGLIEVSAARTDATIDAHPLVREYLGRRLRESNPEGWREGHRRIYEHLKARVPHRPDGLAGLQPLYQAVAHGCLAGLQQQACDEVYRDRILRGNEFYSTFKLGAVGADLGAVACFFDERWSRVSTALSEPDRAWLLAEAAFRLRALGRLEEAIEPMRAGLEMLVRREDWQNASTSASNLSELALTLGLIAEAVADSERSVDYADRSGDAFVRMAFRTTHAGALQQQGREEEALTLFVEAEKMQAEDQPAYPLLYSMAGYRYCELLLSAPERAAWRIAACGGADALPALREKCDSVSRRAAQTLDWWVNHFTNASILDIALNDLTLGRSAFLLATLSPAGAPALLAEAGRELAAAVDGLRAAGTTDEVPRALLARAWLNSVQGDPAAARADLDEAWQIASRGGMRLFMADIHLHRARLFHDRDELAKARVLIEQCGYWRRREELADAESAAANW